MKEITKEKQTWNKKDGKRKLQCKRKTKRKRKKINRNNLNQQTKENNETITNMIFFIKKETYKIDLKPKHKTK